MTQDQRNSLAFAIRIAHGYCCDVAGVLEAWLRENPEIDPREARAFAGAALTLPFPSIRGRKEGPFPVYPERPYYDARARENAERGALTMTPCLHEEAQ